MSQIRLDLVEEKDKFLIHADVPGFTKDQIRLDINDGMLTLSAQKGQSNEVRDPDRRYHRVERSSGSITRSIRLPDNVKEDQITASAENGVLNVVLPKQRITERKGQKRVQIS